MTDQITNLNPGQGYADAELQQRNKVLRNTYMLLSMSLIPTVLGAWLGVELGLASLFRGWLGMLLFIGVAFGFIYGIKKTQNSAAGVPMLLGFTFFMGLMLSPMIQVTLGFKNGPQLIMTAFAGTAGVFMGMAALSSVIKRDLSGMGKFLFVGLIMLVVGGLINAFVGSTAGMIVLSMVSIGIFSAYMLYDIKQILDGGETNYISATLSLYLDIINVFQSLLALLGIFGGERD
jgi:modulator of FtsH protease